MQIKIYSDILRMKQGNFHCHEKSRILNKYGIQEKVYFISTTFDIQTIILL